MQPTVSALLSKVSRSFYLTLRVLPGAIRPQISLAYLLARITDTIADTRLIPVGHRRAALREMRTAIQAVAEGRRTEMPDFGELAEAQDAPAGQGSPAERALLDNVGEVLEALGSLVPADAHLIRDLLEIITRGQESDLVRFGSASAEQIAALDTDTDLQEYTYCVAGCVGEFWTRMCRAHLFARAELDDTFLLTNGIRFGKGLQLVNILRDLPRDLRQGRCYIPRTRLVECGLEPVALLDATEMGRFRPLYASYLEQAKDLLKAGWAYTNALPQGQMRVHLACAWPALIGVKTLARLRAGNVLDGRQRIKVSRGEVRQLMLRSLLCYPNPRAWDRLFDRAGADPRYWPL
ncbi:MAG: phytoene/squalene synthase family protein [Acidobacteriota bacterium]|jgi:farnesyl-diphosphate farnesyltransferase